MPSKVLANAVKAIKKSKNTISEKQLLDQFKNGKYADPVLNLVDGLLKGTFSAYVDPSGVRKLLKYDDRTKEYKDVNEDAAISDVLDQMLPHLKSFNKTKAESYFRTWFHVCPSIKNLPSALVFGNTPIRTFNRVNYELKPGPIDAFEFVWKDMECNAYAFMAFIWSLFVPDSQNTQYVWLFGEGDDCKSIICNLLEKMLKGAYGSSDTQNSYWLAECVGKKLIVFADTKNAKFPMGGTFKAVTGGDTVTVTQKYEKAYSAKIEAKFIFTSNEEPMISSSTADKKRCIFVSFKKKTDYYPDLVQKLEEQIPHFLYECKKQWEKLQDNLGRIKADYEILNETIEEFEGHFKKIFEANLVLDPNSYIHASDLRQKLYLNENYKWSDFKKWIKATYSYEIKWNQPKNINGKTQRVIMGLRFKGGKS